MRQFIIDTQPDSKGLIYLTGKDFKYIRQVLRLCEGDMIPVVAGGKKYDTTLCAVDDSKKKITLSVCDVSNETPSVTLNESRPEFWLIQFIPKPQKMELIIRQAVECGVSVIVPVLGEYTQKGSEKSLISKSTSDAGRQDRIERIIREARQQSGSPIDTKVLEPVTLEKACSLVNEKRNEAKEKNLSSVTVSLYERNEDSVMLHEAVKNSTQENKIGFAAIAVGCEGGISPDEIVVLKNAGFKTVHFDANILRCETASLYGMACLENCVLEKF